MSNFIYRTHQCRKGVLRKVAPKEPIESFDTPYIAAVGAYSSAYMTFSCAQQEALDSIHERGLPFTFILMKPEYAQQQVIRETFQLVSKRDDNVCNFLEGGTLIGGSDYKIIYRHYATLYFVFCVDSSESELGILDLIQVFVETLDKCFENVCELDLIFHVDKVHYILNELVMGGMVLETSMTEIITRIEEQNKIEKQEAGLSAAPARAVSAVKNMNLPQQIKDIKLPDLPSIGNLKF
ncbi:hypothetical protein HPB49_008572 [Dermacentor silvarum]|uniref:Uncharacterized protein n=1 Tax=Dermacentor silvarum TaxID=543639 RepID=A0ACB8CK76_DERSI|nr:hypothetical protein HPB49_008572 [Dermacentor silvarum]